ncbi:hypothetical protein ACFE04_028642 [Oxalis oulophora]
MGVNGLFIILFLALLLLSSNSNTTTAFRERRVEQRHKNAYATMMYMGTPKDYEYYVATRVMIKSLAKLQVQADLVIIASKDVPPQWVRAMEEDDGARVVSVENLDNPYKNQPHFDKRFKLTLNKLYAWSLTDYDRVVMLDSDNLFLRKTDELFQCGQFCAVFINPCIFHTGLFVLQPSMDVFKDMVHQLEIGKDNPDGADQGFIGGYFPELLDKPMFHPPTNGTKLNGQFRLPLGYQMDATYYYLRLKWNIPCGPNSVITFPGAAWLKPWFWWAWPVLPLGLDWHEQRRVILGRVEKNISILQTSLKITAMWLIFAAYVIPFFVIPHTIHPVTGWSLYLLGSFALCSIAINVFLLPMLPVLGPWIGIFGSLLVMAYPWYSNGIIRALSVFGYAFCAAPVVWVSLVKIMNSLQMTLERENFFPRLGETILPSSFNKLY